MNRRVLVPDGERPYSPDTLATRWGCSAGKIRAMCRNGEIASFTLGKLIRIPAAEVERVECQSTPSPDTGESGRLPSEMVNVAADVIARLRNGEPELLRRLYGTGHLRLIDRYRRPPMVD